MTPSKLALETAKRLVAKGWKRGSYGPANGPNCVMGAMRHLDSSCTLHSEVSAVKWTLDEMDSYGSAFVMNDAQDTTAEDMVMALLLAAEILKDNGQ